MTNLMIRFSARADRKIEQTRLVRLTRWLNGRGSLFVAILVILTLPATLDRRATIYARTASSLFKYCLCGIFSNSRWVNYEMGNNGMQGSIPMFNIHYTGEKFLVQTLAFRKNIDNIIVSILDQQICPCQAQIFQKTSR